MRSCDDPGRPPGGADLHPLTHSLTANISIKPATHLKQTLKASDKENTSLEPFEDKAASRRRCRQLCVCWMRSTKIFVSLWLHTHLVLFSQQPGRFLSCDFGGRGQLIHVHEAAIYFEQIWSRPPCLHSLFAPKQKPTSHKCVNYILPSPFTLQTVQSQHVFKTQRLTRHLILRKDKFSFQSSNSAVLYI